MTRGRLLLLRHGRTDAAPGVLLGSRTDPSLSALGRSQAVAAGRTLRSRSPVLVVCSPQRRARETAALAFPGGAVRVDERWRELDFGMLTGLTWAESKARYGQAAVAWRREAAAPPGGEEPAVLRRRVLEAVLDLLGRVEGEPLGDIVVVSHATPIRAVVGTARGWALADHRRVRAVHGGLRVVRAGPATMARWAAAARPGGLATQQSSCSPPSAAACHDARHPAACATSAGEGVDARG